jgi:basic membrane protein A
MKRVDNAIFQVVSDFKKGIFKGGTTQNFGLHDGAVDIAPSTAKMIPPALLNEVLELKKKIAAEKIKIPADEKSYNAFTKTLK